jgi:hypothetical protein
MTEARHEPILPRVTESDLSQVMYEDITDPSHLGRWVDFAETNPVLSRYVLDRAFERMKGEMSSDERVKRVIDLLSYVVSALEIAMQHPASDDETIDGEDPQP